MVENWKIGAVLGGILGLTVPYIPLMWYYYAGTPATYIPPNPSTEGVTGFYLIWSFLAVFGVILGAIIGYLADKYKKSKE